MTDSSVISRRESRTDRGRSTYRLFGLNLASSFPFASRLVEAEGPPDITFTCTDEAPVDDPWQQTAPVFSTPPMDDGRIRLQVYWQEGYDVVHFTDVADFFVWPDRIVCHLLDSEYDYAVEIHLLGVVLSYYLERQGTPALHASAVVVDDRTAAFLATNKGGKSTLAANLMQAGYPMLTDDILAVLVNDGQPIGHAGYPQMRMWPDQAAHFVGSAERLEYVHPHLSKRRVPVGDNGVGSFCRESRPLARFYVPSRRPVEEHGETVQIHAMSSKEALIELMRQSFLPNIVATVGLHAERLGPLSQIVNNVPVRRIVYPSGVEYLPAVRQAILDDMRR